MIEFSRERGSPIMQDIVPFQPIRFGKDANFQTVAAHLLAKVSSFNPEFRGLHNTSVQLPTQDASGDRLSFYVHEYEGYGAREQPAVVLVHGLEADADGLYIIKITDKLLRAGFHVVRMNLRGCGAGKGLARHSYSAALTLDLETVLEYVKREVSPVVALVGYSLGAALTLKYLGEDQAERNRQREVLGARPVRGKIRDRHVDVFCAISPPLDLLASSEQLDGPNCRFYRRRFLKAALERVSAVDFPHVREHMDELRNAGSFFEFDNLFTAPVTGFQSAVDYYRRASAIHVLPNIETTGLLLHALDDPLIFAGTFTNFDWSRVPGITPHLTEYGGHLGWVAPRHPLFPDRRWMDYRVLHYLLDLRDNLVPARRRPSWWDRIRDWSGWTQ
jgi:predicted alpha/beta-fold hydrolase